MRTFATPLFFLALLASAVCAAADPISLAISNAAIYSNTRDTFATSGLGGNDHVVIDDVLVPGDRNPHKRPLAITSVTVLVSPSLSPNVFSLWNYPAQSDGTPGLGRVLIGTANVPVGSDLVRVTFGNGSNTLFTARPVFSVEPGFGLLYIGLGAVQPTGWQWADGPDVNSPTAYFHNLNVNKVFVNSSPGPPFPPHRSQFMEIQATPVPEPATFSMLAAGLLVSWSSARRLKKRR